MVAENGASQHGADEIEVRVWGVVLEVVHLAKVRAYFDPELRGRNGYRESTGLQDRREGNRASNC